MPEAHALLNGLAAGEVTLAIGENYYPPSLLLSTPEASPDRDADQHVTGRLIVRRVKRLNPASLPASQGELFTAYRHHAVFTDSGLPMLEAETNHRAHAIIEQVHADLRSGPLAHFPSGAFAANGAWLVLAAMAFNLTRAAGSLASVFHAKATTATIRTQLITVPTRLVLQSHLR